MLIRVEVTIDTGGLSVIGRSPSVSSNLSFRWAHVSQPNALTTRPFGFPSLTDVRLEEVLEEGGPLQNGLALGK
jgi:hypothetical protein